MATLTHKRQRSDSDNDEIDTSTIFRTQENFAKHPDHRVKKQ